MPNDFPSTITALIRSSTLKSSFCYPSIDGFFAEVKRVLRPGGHLHYTDLRLAHELVDWRTAIAR